MSLFDNDDASRFMLKEAVRNGDLEEVRRMLDEQPQLIHTTSWVYDYSLLWDACDLNSDAVSGSLLRLLLERGAEANGRGPNGFAPLCHAARQGHLETIRILLDAGAGITGRNNNGSPLGNACTFGMHKAVELLLARGADINGEYETSSSGGMTPLMCAVLCGQAYVVRVLLASGVDIDRVCVDVKMVHCGDNLQTMSPLKQARRREAVLTPGSANLIGKPHVGDEINSLFDVFLLARLIAAGRRSGPLAARRRVLGSKDLTRVIAKFLARKIRTPPVRH